jgi:hypothetical protein
MDGFQSAGNNKGRYGTACGDRGDRVSRVCSGNEKEIAGSGEFLLSGYENKKAYENRRRRQCLSPQYCPGDQSDNDVSPVQKLAHWGSQEAGVRPL